MSKKLEEKVLNDLIRCTRVNDKGVLLFNDEPVSIINMMKYTIEVYGISEFTSREMYGKYLKKMNEIRMKPYMEEPDEEIRKKEFKNKKLERSPLLNSHTFINDKFL